MDDLDIFSPSIAALGTLDVYEALTWERRYKEAGAFEITAAATPNNLTLLQQNNILYRGDAVESGIIYRRNIKNDADSGTLITASGRFLSHILFGHIIRRNAALTGNVETNMRTLISETVMNSSNDDYIPFLRLGELNGFTDTYDSYIKYPDLHDYLSALTNATGIAFRCRLSPSENVVYFETYKPVDRSVEQTVNPQIIFSEEYDNLEGAEYEQDRTSEYNAAIARNGSTIVDYNPENKTGINKRTIYVEGSSSDTSTSLLEAAKEALVKATDNFTGTISQTASPAYKTDYDIGDIVTVISDEWNITKSDRITSISETIDGNGYNVIPTFGSPLPTIAEILKSKN